MMIGIDWARDPIDIAYSADSHVRWLKYWSHLKQELEKKEEEKQEK